MTTKYVHKIYEAELAALLRVAPERLPRLQKKGAVPPVAGSDGEGTYWSIPAVRYAIHATGQLAPRDLVLEWWPDADQPAEYLGAHVLRKEDLGPPSAVLQRWSTRHGIVVIGWGMDGSPVSEAAMRSRVGDAAACLYIGNGFGIYGPDVFTWDPADGERTDIEWPDLARVMGRPMPFWPFQLRIPELITTWAPGDAPVLHHGTPGLDLTPLLEMALLHRPDDPVHRAMIHTAQLIQHTAVRVADLDILNDKIRNGVLASDDLSIAALPTAQLADPAGLDETTRRAGWREVQQRQDWLAEKCMLTVLAWDGGKNLTHTQPIDIDLDSPVTRELVDRLEPATRTAQYMLLDPQRAGEAFVDPLTDAPVTIDHAENSATMLIPQRLPTTSPLAELILDGDVWVRTQDGTLYPAPRDSGFGLTWGYSGGGPHALALLAERLLEDIASPGVRLNDETGNEGLRRLFAQKWPDGTTFTRDQIEEARDS